MATCHELLEEGMHKVVWSLTFMLLEVVSLINFQILQDVNRTAPDISETY
jgi:hypothetical protein